MTVIDGLGAPGKGESMHPSLESIKRSLVPAAVSFGLAALFAIPVALVADPGESYTTREQAVEASIHDVQRETIDNNHDTERGSVVYEQRDGSFTYTPPVGQSDGEHDFGPTLSDISAVGGIPTDLVHSHDDPGSYRPGLSDDDRRAGDVTRTDVHAVEGGRSANDPITVWTRDFENKQTTRTQVGELDDIKDTKDCPPPGSGSGGGSGSDPDGDNGTGCETDA
jgi:hypothetical protein